MQAAQAPERSKTVNKKKAVVKKQGRKWIAVYENGEVAYTGKSRVECFRWAYENNVEITGYQHGGK